MNQYTKYRFCDNCESCGITIKPVSGDMFICGHCEGSGYRRLECEACDGKGSWKLYMAFDDEREYCRECNGRGTVRVEEINPPTTIKVTKVDYDLGISIKQKK